MGGEVSHEFEKVKSTAIEIDVATATDNDADCHAAMLEKKEKYPKLMLTNVFNTFGPIMGFLSRLGAEFWTVITFFKADNGHSYISALLLLLCLIITGVQLGMERPQSIIYEAKRCWDRGIYSKKYLAITRADK